MSLMRRLIAMLLLAIVATAPAAAAPRDWTTVVTRTPAGAYVMGNPAAKVRLVEYLSLTCGHCAAFAAEGFPALRGKYIRSGRLSLELRHAVRDGADFAASLLVRCTGPRGYFPTIEAMLAGQSGWLARAVALPAAAPTDQAGRDAALVAMARGSGLDAIAARHGLPAAKAAACISDPAGQQQLVAMANEAMRTRNIPGTPSFLLGDRLIEGSDWAAIEPQIVAALK